MFIIAVLSLILGIYLGVLYVLPLKLLTVLLFFFICLTPVIILKKIRLASVLIFVCFLITGIIRIGIVTAKATAVPYITEENEIYEGYITDSSKHIKTIRLITPLSLNNAGAALITDQDLNIGDRISAYGKIKELSPSFRNPYTISWKWLKKLEGVSYEIKGKVINVLPGKNLIQILMNS